LGAQLLASAAGARIYPGDRGFELGIHPVHLTATARRDPVFGDLPTDWFVAHWHGDTFDSVPGAIALASSEQYEQQAFRLGNAWGLQFHPELDAQTFVNWLKAAPDDVARAGKSERELVQTEVPRLRAAERTNAKFLESLARQISKIGH
jgi:GMP synthase (glutamine-hydrolysing)